MHAKKRGKEKKIVGTFPLLEMCMQSSLHGKLFLNVRNSKAEEKKQGRKPLLLEKPIMIRFFLSRGITQALFVLLLSCFYSL